MNSNVKVFINECEQVGNENITINGFTLPVYIIERYSLYKFDYESYSYKFIYYSRRLPGVVMIQRHQEHLKRVRSIKTALVQGASSAPCEA